MSHYIESWCPVHGDYSYDVDRSSGCPECFTLDEAMTYLYGYEINCYCISFWDGGFDVKLGDNMNGFKAEATFEADKLYKAGNWLIAEAKKAYPEIQWEEKVS